MEKANFIAVLVTFLFSVPKYLKQECLRWLQFEGIPSIMLEKSWLQDVKRLVILHKQKAGSRQTWNPAISCRALPVEPTSSKGS